MKENRNYTHTVALWMIAIYLIVTGLIGITGRRHDRIETLTRDFDTINTGTGPNTGTGMTLLQQAQLLKPFSVVANK